MQKRTMPDSKRAARRLAAIIHSDLSDRSPGTNFVVSHVSETFDDREGVSVHLIECAAPDGSRAMISVRPLPATVLAEQLPALAALRRTRVSHRADSVNYAVDLIARRISDDRRQHVRHLAQVLVAERKGKLLRLARDPGLVPDLDRPGDHLADPPCAAAGRNGPR